MDHDEGPLRERLRAALRNAARWRAVACALGVALALSLAAGVAGGLSLAYSWKKQLEAEERERVREAEEERDLEQARLGLEKLDRHFADGEPDFEEALERLRRSMREVRRQEALAPVAGGLAVAALGRGDD